MDNWVLGIQLLQDAFYAREVQRCRFNKMQEDDWISGISRDVERDERATAVAKDWLKRVLSSDKRDFYNFVPPLDHETCKLFVRFFWLFKANDISKAKELLRETRRSWGLEPQSLYALSHGERPEPGGDTPFSTPATLNRSPPLGGQASGFEDLAAPTSTRTSSVCTTTRQIKLPAALRRKPNVSNLTPSVITKHQGAARTSFKKKGKQVLKARSTARGLNPAANDNESSSALLPKVTRGATVTFSDSQDQCSIAASDRAAGCSSSAPEPPSYSVSGLVTGQRRTHPMEDNERGSKRTRVARLSMQERRSSVSSELPARLYVKTHTPSDLASSGAITWLDRGLARIEPMAQECHNDEDDPYGITMASECPSAVHVGPEKEPEAAIFPKPLLPVKPPIWAESRQEVCESLDSFRSFQGGVYHIHDVAKGYLLGGHSSSRDIFHHGGRLIISHGGGKAEALHSRNRCLEVRGPGDQLEDDRSVRALLNNYECRRPLVLLADDNYRLFPFDLTARGYTYVVLGLYWITHAWAERQQVNRDHDVVRYKFVFQWCQGQGDPWWLQDTEHVSTTTQAEVIPVHEGQSNDVSYVGQSVSQSPRLEMTIHDCRHCRMGSRLVYQGAPMCLQPRCQEFFRVKASAPAAGDSLPSSLLYSTELLRLLPANHLPVSAASFFPVSPSKISTAPRPFAKGMHCQACGRLSTRFKWQSFECSNNHCKRTYDVPKFRFSHKDFWLQEQTLKFFQQRIAEDSGIVVRELEFQAKTDGSALPYVQKFELPHDRGHIFLIPGHPSINKVANRLFYEYQDQANEGKFQFRRWPLRAHKCRGQLLSNYFSQNTGAPYQYIGGADRTTPLEQGAEPVLGALKLIQDRIASALGETIGFNEVLSAAYMEKQKMAFHSDSERGLGPVIASLSLGCVAEIHFRLHSKHTVSEGPRKVAMSLILRHGDVLVMKGAAVQEFYEHAVVPKNFRIVATARTISPENYATYSNDGVIDGHS